ncbi:hypothetical protein IQ07DRAFT_604840 [Pyrenochaeta sp. DS3sAY3a]|nr:hypothetical protein IQ07DRAFT_604840 [Pyrenochaeta sp. DS3sAY3a]
MSTNRWIWSPPHNDYYMVTYNNLGQPIYEWGREYLHRTHSTPNPSASLGNVTSGTAEPEAAEHDLGWSAFDNRFDELWGRNMSRHLDGRSNAALRSTIVGPLDQGSRFISTTAAHH